MINPLAWYRERQARKAREQYVGDLHKKWIQDVWNWHVPLQMESIAARRPFNHLCAEERSRVAEGQVPNGDRLKSEFASLFRQMADLNNRLIDSFQEWYHSIDAAEWKALIEREQLAEAFLADAETMLRQTGQTTLFACAHNAEGLIEIGELYERCR